MKHNATPLPPLIPAGAIENWSRVGRGRELQFFATDREVVDFLENGLPESDGPYSLCAVKTTRPEARSVDEAILAPVADLEALVKSGYSRYWIVPAQLLPHLADGRPEKGIDAWLSVNGLLLLHHGVVFKGKRDCSRIAIVNRIENSETGEVREFTEYGRFFTALKAYVEKRLAFATWVVFANGTSEESTIQRMTASVAQAASAGDLYTRRPGRQLW